MSRVAAPATTRDETPVFFPVGEEKAFGVFTLPTIDPRGIAVIVLPGTGFATMVNRNRLAARLCRRLAALGYHTLRTDYLGVGDSTGGGGPYLLERPFLDHLLGAIRWVEGQGIDRFVLVGTCFGAWTALIGASKFDQVHGAVLVSIPSFVEDEEARALPVLDGRHLRRRIRGLFDPKRRALYLSQTRSRIRARVARPRARRNIVDEGASRWVRPEFFRAIDALIHRRVPVLFAFGTEDKSFRAFQRARHRVDPIIRQAAGLIELQVVPGHVHGLPDLEGQEQVLRLVEAWLERYAQEDTARSR